MNGSVRTLILLLIAVEIFWLLPQKNDSPSLSPNTRNGAFHIFIPASPTVEDLTFLARKAKKLAIDFLIVTLPPHTELPSDIGEGNYEGVDIYFERELVLEAGDAVVFHSHTSKKQTPEKELKSLAWTHYLTTQQTPDKEDIFLVISHPESKSRPWNRLDKFSEGIELFNLGATWQDKIENSPLKFLLTCLVAPFNNYLAALRTVQISTKSLQGWDAINTLNPGHFAIAGQEIPALSLPFKKLPFLKSGWNLSHSNLGVALNTVWSESSFEEDFSRRKVQTYLSLLQGRSALFFPIAYPEVAANWALACPNRSYNAGDRLSSSAAQGCRFIVSLDPRLTQKNPTIRLYKDGRALNVWTSPQQISLEHTLTSDTAGVYRLEITIPMHTPLRWLLNTEVPYLFYNPIYVR